MKGKIKYRVIKDLDQYNEYCNLHESLLLKDELKYTDELELLELLIEDYDQRLMKKKNANLNPVEILKSLLKESKMKQIDLSKSINVSRQLISDVLNYRRSLSKEMIIKLSKFYSMNQEAFSREYSLKSNKNKVEKGANLSLGNN